MIVLPIEMSTKKPKTASKQRMYLTAASAKVEALRGASDVLLMVPNLEFKAWGPLMWVSSLSSVFWPEYVIGTYEIYEGSMGPLCGL